MKTLNPKILMTMKYLEYPKSVSLDELKRNMDNADSYDTASLASNVASHAAFDAASYAYYGALHPDVPEDAAEAHDHINEYFKFSDENKQDYLDELERTK